MLKRKVPESKARQQLTGDEQVIYNVIKSKTDMGITTIELNKAITMRQRVIAGCIKSLQAKAKIKEVKSVRNKKIFMAVEFEPSKELTGGVWFNDGELDTDFIDKLMKISLSLIRRNNVAATAEQVAEMVRNSRVINVKVSVDQIKEILKALVLDGELGVVKSTGLGEYASVPAGMDCYRINRIPQADAVGCSGAMVSIPCGVCPRINQCTPDGVISPVTCVYFNKWISWSLGHVESTNSKLQGQL